MISRADGEVSFSDGLVIRPHMRLVDLPVTSREVSGGSWLGWVAFVLGTHPSEYGEFLVDVACSTADDVPVFLVVLSSENSFFDEAAKEDREREVFHEGVLARELSGQREFAWGEAFCKYDRKDHRNCLNVVYTAGPKVPGVPGGGLKSLAEHGFPESS